MTLVTFTATDGSVTVTLPMGDGPAQLTGGGGGWAQEERWGLPPATIWKSPEAFEQTIPILLDGGPRVSMESNIAALLKLSRPRGERVPPPALWINGPAVHETGRTWVMSGAPEPGTRVIRREGDGNRVRQDYVVTLVEYSEVEVLIARSPAKRNRARKRRQGGRRIGRVVGSPTAGLGTRNTYIVQAGDTLSSIAAKVYGDPNQWKRIANANGIRDPRSPGRPGRVLVTP